MNQFPPSSPLLHSEHDDITSTHTEFKDTFDALTKQHALKLSLNKIERDDRAYLTPDPSSSIGNITINSESNDADEEAENIESSPSKHLERVKPGIKRPAEIDVTRPLSPSNFHNVIHVPLNGDVFKIGRSSLSCSFKLNSSNKLISRVHAQIYYDSKAQRAVLKCLGYNGLNITIPETISVNKIAEHEYTVITTDDFDETDDENTSDASSHVLSKTPAYTNFYMLAGETVHMPLITGTVLDFRGDLALLVYDTDKITINPQTQEVTRTPYTPNPRRLSTEQLAKIVNEKKLKFSRHPRLEELEQKTLKSAITSPRPIERDNLSNTIIYKRTTVSATVTPVTTPVKRSEVPIPLAPSPSPCAPKVEASVSSIQEDKENLPIIPKKENTLQPVERAPLAELPVNVPTHDFNDSPAPAPVPSPTPVQRTVPSSDIPDFDEPDLQDSHDIHSFSEPMTKSRSVSPSPVDDLKKRPGRPKKIKQTEEESLRNMPESEISSILATVPSLEDISNLITNHLAYSRVLQTPFAIIRELNAVKQHGLSKKQLRCVLIHHIAPVGVIFRKGKDAAGKPLDEEYYYIPEKDTDTQRVQLVEELKGSSSHLRSCRKTHKQYFWKKPKI